MKNFIRRIDCESHMQREIHSSLQIYSSPLEYDLKLLMQKRWSYRVFDVYLLMPKSDYWRIFSSFVSKITLKFWHHDRAIIFNQYHSNLQLFEIDFSWRKYWMENTTAFRKLFLMAAIDVIQRRKKKLQFKGNGDIHANAYRTYTHLK